MMHVEQRLRYGSLPQLDTAELGLECKNSDLSMLIILPNTRTGLKDLEEQLKITPLKDIMSGIMSATKAIVDLSKFTVEFEVELQNAFKRLDISCMISQRTDFGKMLRSDEFL